MKDKLIDTVLAVALGCSIGIPCVYDDIKSNNCINNSEVTAEKAIKKIFSPGTHIIEYSNVEMVGMSEMYEGYVDLNIDVPEGYELVDYEISDRKMGPKDSYYNRGYFVFVNTEEVEAIGVYNVDLDKYLFSTPGAVIKEEKKVKTRKR